MIRRSLAANLGRCFLALAVAALGLGTRSARADLIVNGGFELPNIGGAPFTAPIGVGSAVIPGWQITSGNVEIVSAAFAPPFQGNQWLDLHGLVAGTIQQTFATDPGVAYGLSFAYANNPNSPFASARMDVLSSAGTLLLTQNVTATGSTFAMMNYTVFEGSFMADSASTTLRFTSTGATFPASGLALDAVSVQGAVPEPAALILFGVGFTALLGYAWRRRHRSEGPVLGGQVRGR